MTASGVRRAGFFRWLSLQRLSENINSMRTSLIFREDCDLNHVTSNVYVILLQCFYAQCQIVYVEHAFKISLRWLDGEMHELIDLGNFEIIQWLHFVPPFMWILYLLFEIYSRQFWINQNYIFKNETFTFHRRSRLCCTKQRSIMHEACYQ